LKVPEKDGLPTGGKEDIISPNSGNNIWRVLMKEHLQIKTRPLACADNVIQGDCWRIMVLTESLIRLEYSADGRFTDAATQIVLNRDFPKTVFSCKETGDGIEIRTDYLKLKYDKKEFSADGLRCQCMGKNSEGLTGENLREWRYGEDERNLKGTVRTLDTVNGACKLEDGILSRACGCAMLDDSRSFLLTPQGWVEPRQKGNRDIYLFAYGHRYREALKDFYFLCGKTPMLPRFALGNWWSRYYPYSEQSYLELMERFEKEDIPFSVAVIDMDWHLVNIESKYGSGWTGFTWNRELFPDPQRFLNRLHERGMKTTLNLHPADGIRGHEKCYPAVAEAMGVDASVEEPVEFDITNPKFLEVYLEKVLHPLEEDGVDFWWMDWQQGTRTKLEGLDPLWMLNHYHFLDSAREGERPMTFSRYAGPGSHRYPIGFSGDTVKSWESLEFQPYFTNTASNIGFGWWSHDIGGHMMGIKDDELETRWYQYGVFSPIMRLHSSCDPFNGKEPWRHKLEAREAMGVFLRLRHKLLPYLYTMNYRAWKEDEPICEPLYYLYPENQESYECKNEYFFGSELLVSPITAPRFPGLNVAKVKTWLPEGMWFDIFTDMAYRGGRCVNLYRKLDSIPVLAKAGAIVPMTDCISGPDVSTNPAELTLRVYPGADNRFALYEDDNTTDEYEKGTCAITEFIWDWEKKRFQISPVSGEASLVPERRNFRVEFYKTDARDAAVFVDGERRDAAVSPEGTTLTVILTDVCPQNLVEIRLPEGTGIAKNPVEQLVYDFLDQAEISFAVKDKIYALVCRKKEDVAALTSGLQAMDVPRELEQAVLELAT